MPISAILVGLIDFAAGFVGLLALMTYYGIRPGWGVFAMPAFVVLNLATALSVGVWLSALNVQFRDVRHAISFLLQLWLFATPVAYSVSVVPLRMRPWLGLNPMVGVVEGFRWCLLGRGEGLGNAAALSSIAVVATLLAGLYYFRRVETTFADIV
jgi:lipopolysaccharide transport system permease protein